MKDTPTAQGADLDSEAPLLEHDITPCSLWPGPMNAHARKTGKVLEHSVKYFFQPMKQRNFTPYNTLC